MFNATSSFVFQIKRYYQNKSKFKHVYSWNNLPETLKDGPYLENLNEYKLIVTHWIALHVNGNCVIYFDSFSVEHI